MKPLSLDANHLFNSDEERFFFVFLNYFERVKKKELLT